MALYVNQLLNTTRLTLNFRPWAVKSHSNRGNSHIEVSFKTAKGDQCLCLAIYVLHSLHEIDPCLLIRGCHHLRGQTQESEPSHFRQIALQKLPRSAMPAKDRPSNTARPAVIYLCCSCLAPQLGLSQPAVAHILTKEQKSDTIEGTCFLTN